MNAPLHHKEKIIIGLTGGYGTGKSTVAAILKGLGAGIIDADKLAHGCFADGQVVRGVVRLLGKDILRRDGSIDRSVVAQRVFSDMALLERLNALVHPEVIRQIRRQIRASRSRIVVLDVPLLFETGLQRLADCVVVVYAPRSAQIDRVRRAAQLSRSGILRRIRCQMPLREKMRRADVVIDNSGTVATTRKKIIQWWKELNA